LSGPSALRTLGALLVGMSLVGSGALATPQEPARPADPEASGVARNADVVPASLARVLEHPSLRGARFGALVVSLPGAETIVSIAPEELFAPASVNKLFTTTAALHLLGSHFAWQTPVAYLGERLDSRIAGDLWVLGRGAPDLVEEKLWVAAAAIREEGIEQVDGDLILDDRFFDDIRYGEGWPGGAQRSEAYHAPVSALMANFAAERGRGGWQAVDDPAMHFGRRFADLLGKAGVSVRGIVRRPLPEELAQVPAPEFSGTGMGLASVPPPLTGLYAIESEPLGRVVMDVNKFSNNVMAETLIKTMGAVEYGSPGTATKGLAAAARVLSEEIGIPLNSYVQADGSGLSRLDRFSPAQVMSLLQHVRTDFHVGPELMASLKLSGLDGWNPAPFRQPPLRGEARVKSGHIRGVNTLSGFIHTASGQTLAFVAMVNDHRSQQWEIDQRMAEIVDLLIRDY